MAAANTKVWVKAKDDDESGPFSVRVPHDGDVEDVIKAAAESLKLTDSSKVKAFDGTGGEVEDLERKFADLEIGKTAKNPIFLKLPKDEPLLKDSKFEDAVRTVVRQEFRILTPAHHTTSYAEYHNTLKSMGLFTPNPIIGEQLRSYEPDDRFWFEVVPPKGKETIVVQPFWTSKIDDLNSKLQTANAAVRLYDSHTSSFLEGKKPDIAIISADSGVPSVFNTVCIGELKGTGDIDDAAMGQLETYLRILLDKQPFRSCVYGFLTDNDVLKVLLAEKNTSTKEITFSLILEATWGGPQYSAQRVMSFLTLSSKATLFYSVPIVDESVQITGLLGHGLSGIVYKGERNGADVVVKVFHDYSKYKTERANLIKLQRKNVPNIPTIVAEWDNVLILKPIGTSFTPPGKDGPTLSPSHVSKFIDVLYQAHQAGLVHRDFSKHNIFAVGNEILLNDWGSACARDSVVPYEGWIGGCSERMLKAIRDSPHEVHYRPCDDLHSLVRTVYCLLFDPTVYMESTKAAGNFWRSRGSVWKDIIEFAENARTAEDYKELGKKLCDVYETVDVHLWDHQ